MSHISHLRDLLGSDALLISDPNITVSYSRDHAVFAQSASPFAVLLARSTQEISTALRYASEHGIPVVARGAGSGLSGGANATANSLVISLEKMNQIITIDAQNLWARVQAGVINLDLDTAAKELGLAYLPDPASRSWSTIGGNVATNAGGMCCVKYGVTSQHIRALQVVLASGEIIELGSATKKGVTTLDLVHLFVGSEGTLGIVTEITANLQVRPSPPATLVATFPTIDLASSAAHSLLQYGPSMLEILDQTTLQAVEAWHPLGFEIAGAVVLMQLDERKERCEEALLACARFEMIDGVFSDDPKDAQDLLRVRQLAYLALERMGSVLLDDVCVPVGQICALVQGVENIAARNNLVIAVFGHAGDGNMHPTIVHDHGDQEGARRAIVAFGEIIELAQSLGGTASGEHGIGSIKTNFVHNEVSKEVIEIQPGIKKLLDPRSILNPGKKLP